MWETSVGADGQEFIISDKRHNRHTCDFTATMTSKKKRLRLSEEAEAVRCSPMYRERLNERAALDSGVPDRAPSVVATTGSLFFESSDVRAWYRGSRTTPVHLPEPTHAPSLPLPSLNTATLSEVVSLVPSSMNSSQNGDDKEDDGGSDSASQRDDTVYSTAELLAMDEATVFAVPTSAALASIKQKAVTSMLPASEKMEPCCVCELSCPSSAINNIILTEAVVERMKRYLGISAAMDVPQFIIDEYDASKADSRLEGILLYPAGSLR